MLRRGLIAASESARLRRFAEDRSISRRVVDRFVSGEALDDAIRVTRELNAQGASVTLDHLGEAVTDEAEARAGADANLDAIARIAEDGLDAGISVKPTALGLDVSEDLCGELVTLLCDAAGPHGIQITLDMEDSDTTQATVDLVARLRGEGALIGCAVQAYLHRTPGDLERLTALGASLRICKGAYAEPDTIAHQGRDEIRDAYLDLVDHVLAHGVYGRFATHDDFLVSQIENLAAQRQLARDAWEFQMLYGVREPLQRDVLQRGHRLRVYVPYGTEWYPYFVRRLAERPANLVFFLRALAGRR